VGGEDATCLFSRAIAGGRSVILDQRGIQVWFGVLKAGMTDEGMVTFAAAL